MSSTMPVRLERENTGGQLRASLSKFTKMVGDHYGGEFVKEPFRKHGISYEAEERSVKGSVAKPPQRPIVLPRHDRLVAQICGLERRTGRSGKDSIDHAPNGHDDLANAVAGAAAATRSKYRYDSSLDWVAGPDADAA